MQSSYREVLRCLLEGIKWLMGPQAFVKVTGKSGISQARSRLGLEPVRQLHGEVLVFLSKGMLCLADRGFFGYSSWQYAQSTGADLLWRIKNNIILPCEKRLSDGSYLSRVYSQSERTAT
jgi:hypothetical protein